MFLLCADDEDLTRKGDNAESNIQETTNTFESLHEATGWKIEEKKLFLCMTIDFKIRKRVLNKIIIKLNVKDHLLIQIEISKHERMLEVYAGSIV